MRDIAAMAMTRQMNPLHRVSLLNSHEAWPQDDLQSDDELEIKVTTKERHGADEDEKRANNGDDHGRVPRRDLDGDHEKLVEN